MQHTDEAYVKATQFWNKALSYCAQKLYTSAILDLRKAIEAHEDYLETAKALLMERARSKKYEEAIAVGLAVLGVEPHNDRLMNQLGNYYRRVGQYEQATKMYQTLLKVFPQHLRAQYNLAACYFKIVLDDEDLIQQTQQVEQFQNYRSAGYQRYYEDDCPRSQPEQLMRDPDKQMILKPEVDDIDIEKVEVWIPRFENWLKQEPDSWERHFDLAVLYSLGCFYDLALKYYHSALKLNPTHPAIQNNIAVLLQTQFGKSSVAKQRWFEILKQHPNDRYAVLNLALWYREHHDPLMALRYFTLLGALLEYSGGAFDVSRQIQQADQAYQQENYELALNLYQKLVKEEPNAEWLYRLGVIEKQFQRTKLAIDYWKQVLELNPIHSATIEALEDYVMDLEHQAHELISDNFLTEVPPLLQLATDAYPMPSTYEILAETYETLGHPKKADEAARQVELLSQRRVGGASELVVKMDDDFNKPLEDFSNYM